MAKAKKSNPKSKKVWARNFYISGFGRVNVGEVASAASLEAWNKLTNVKPKLEDVPENIPPATSE